MQLPSWHIGHADSHAYVVMPTVEAVIKYLISIGAGRPLRWHRNLLHTAPYRGKRAFAIDQFYRGRHHEPSMADKLCILDALAEHHASRPLWRYQYAGKMLVTYRRAFAHLKASGECTVKMRWDSPRENLQQFRDSFVRAMHRRINLKAHHEPDFRKWFPEWQQAAYRDSLRIRGHLTSRIAVHELETEEARARFGHIISEHP